MEVVSINLLFLLLGFFQIIFDFSFLCGLNIYYADRGCTRFIIPYLSININCKKLPIRFPCRTSLFLIISTAMWRNTPVVAISVSLPKFLLLPLYIIIILIYYNLFRIYVFFDGFLFVFLQKLLFPDFYLQ